MVKTLWIIYIVLLILGSCVILGILVDYIDPCGWNVCEGTIIEHQRSYEATAAEGERLLDIQLTAQAEEK